MEIILSNSTAKPIYEQITDQIKHMILDGTLKGGDALPSMRTLAQDLRISVITTKRAYNDLEAEGYITTVAGKGCFVSSIDPELLRENNVRKMERHMQDAIDIAKRCGIGLGELTEILEILFEEE